MARPRQHIMALLSLLDEAGATNVHWKYGGSGHIRITYTHNGKESFYICSATVSDVRSNVNALAELRRHLGPVTTFRPPPPSRTLEELWSDAFPKKEENMPLPDPIVMPQPSLPPMTTPTAVKAPPRYGTVALYHNKEVGSGDKCLAIQLPDYVYLSIGSPPRAVISRVDHNTWKITPDRGGNTVRKVNKMYALSTTVPTSLYKDLETWGASEAECVVVDESVLVSVNLEKLIPIRVRTKPGQAPAPPTPAPLLMQHDTPTKANIRLALDIIHQVEDTMPLKLVRVHGRLEFKLDLESC